MIDQTHRNLSSNEEGMIPINWPSSQGITVILGKLGVFDSFSRSNGTILARLYERLTKASRRRLEPIEFGFMDIDIERAYRQGVYDAFKALQDEVT